MRLGSYGDRAVRQIWASDRGYLLESEMCARLDMERPSDCEVALRYPVRKGLICREIIEGVARYRLGDPARDATKKMVAEPAVSPPPRPVAAPQIAEPPPAEQPPEELGEPPGAALAGFMDRMVRTTIPVGEASESRLEEFERLVGEDPGRPEVPAPLGSREMLFTVFAGETVDQVQRKLVLTTLQRCGNVKTAAAKQLGVGVKTLYNWLNAYLEQGFPASNADLQQGMNGVQQDAHTPPARPPGPQSFRCGLFSDGTFVLEVNGERITLEKRECIQLINFVDRLATEE